MKTKLIIIFLYLVNLSYAQPANDLPCDAIDLGELNLGNTLVLNNQTNVGANGENKTWRNDERESCKGSSVYNSTVYYKFRYDDFINGATVTITPTSGTIDVILLDAENCNDLITEGKGRWYTGTIGSRCNLGVGDQVQLLGLSCIVPTGQTVYIMVASDFGGGTFNIRVDPVAPTGCDGCQNGPETSIDSSHPVSFTSSVDEVTICEGEQTSLKADAISGVSEYTWERLFDGSTSVFSTTQPIWQATEPGIYEFTASDGCTNYKSNPIEVQIKDTLKAEQLTVNGSTEFCAGDSVELEVLSKQAVYTWYNGSNALANSSAEIMVYETGDYFAITSSDCDVDTSELVTIQVNQPNAPPDFESQTVCEGESVILGEDGSYEWFADSSGDIPLQSNSGQLQLNDVDFDTLYYAASISEAKCYSKLIPVKIEVSPLPDIQLTQDTLVRIGESLQLFASGGVFYRWFPSDYLSNDTIANPITQPLDDINYTLEVSSGEGCSNTADVFIEVLGDIRVPNAFSPNGDGFNDTWVIEYIEGSPNAEVKIVNRYGNEVYRAAGNIEPWDGTFQGNELPSDTYFYQILLDRDSKPITGYIDLLK